MDYADTPRTNAGNTTYTTDGHDIDNLSMEKSSISPLKKENDLLLHMKSKRGTNLRTPRLRTPLHDRNKNQTAPGPAEFTPLLKSVTKRNLLRAGKENGGVQTPAFLRDGYKAKDSPALETGESYVLDDESVSSAGGNFAELPDRAIESSSAQSTPLAVLPKRIDDRLNHANPLPLREQEERLTFVEKENFALKLKIHFLDESLQKAGPGINQAALKENTELKTKKMIMHRELARTKKTLIQAESDIEQYRVHLEDVQERAKRKQADAGLREDFENVQKDSAAKDTQLEDLRRQLANAEGDNHEIAELKEVVEELEAELRERDRHLEEKVDDIEGLKERRSQDSDELANLRRKLDDTRRQLVDYDESRSVAQGLRDDLKNLTSEIEEAKNEVLRAQMDRQKAEDDLNELRDEMANKSFSTKGLSRQLEEKANKAEIDLASMRSSYAKLQDNLNMKTLEVKNVQKTNEDERRAGDHREQELRDEIEDLRHDNDTITRKNKSLTVQMQSSTEELQYKSEEKDFLQTRHDALSTESQTLQKDLKKAQETLRAFERRVEEERQQSQDLQAQSKAKVQELSTQFEILHQTFEEEKNRFKANEESWSSQRKELQSQKNKIEQQALGLQKTVDKLQASEGTLSERETNLQQGLESEKQRHRNEEAVLGRQINELQQEVRDKHDALDSLRSEVTKVKEDLRMSQRLQNASEEKVQALEDEMVVLQSEEDEEIDRINDELDAAKEEAEILSNNLQVMKQELDQSETAKAKAEADLHDLMTDRRVGGLSKDHLDSRLRDAESQLQRAKAEKKSLHDQLGDANAKLASLQLTTAEAESNRNEAASLRHDLSAAREKDTEQLQREVKQKNVTRDMRRQISDLECKIRTLELSKLAVDSPKSSIGGSARKTEIIEVSRQLVEARQQIKDLRATARDSEREAQRKYAALEKEAHQRIDEFQQNSEDLEHEIANLRLQLEEQAALRDSAEQTIKRLRTRLHGQDKDLHAARLNQADDRTIAEERKDLHEMLKDAKLEAEDLKVQIASHDKRMQTTAGREMDLRSQLKRVREERTAKTHKVIALTTELESVQRSYERSIENLARQQKIWDEERRSIVSRVRFPNMSVSSLHAAESTDLKQLELDIQNREKRHAAELKGMAKHIQWFKAQFAREEEFKEALVNEKKYLLLQIEMFNACNAVKLQMLKEMGAAPESKMKRKQPSFRVVAMMALAVVRLQRLRREWAGRKKIQASLIKMVEQKRQSRKSTGLQD